MHFPQQPISQPNVFINYTIIFFFFNFSSSFLYVSLTLLSNFLVITRSIYSLYKL